MKKSMEYAALVPIFLIVMLASCSMKQNVYIAKSGDGHVSFDIQLADYLTEVIDQITMLFESETPIPNEQESFFDLTAMREDFRQREGIELISLETPTKERLVGEFSFTDINLLFQDVKKGSAESRLIRLERQGQVTELTVRLTREAIETLLEENPSFNNPLVENFGPMTTEGLTDEDYLDMMEFALGEAGRLGIQESTLELTIQVEGRIIDQKGGRLVSKNTVNYSIPMLPVLMLREPLEYSLRYQ